MAIHPGLVRRGNLLRHYGSGQCKNRYLPKGCRHGAYGARRGKAIHLRHLQIHQDKIEMIRRQPFKCLTAAGCKTDRMAHICQ